MDQPVTEPEIVNEGESAGPDSEAAVTPAEPESPLAQAIRERDEYLELARKSRAELENYRRRIAREREADKQRYQADLMRGLLNPLDDFGRALKHAEEEKKFDTLYEGVLMVRDSLWKVVGAAGLEKISGEVGTAFNPNIHDALMKIPSHEYAPNVIVEEVTSGYRMGDTVLRASKVVVSAGPPVQPTPSSELPLEREPGSGTPA